MINSNEIIRKMTEYFAKLGYSLEKPTGLVSPVFPGTFNPSAAHAQVMDMISGAPIQKPRNFFVVEQCFRHVDLDKIGSSHHSAFFQMAAFVFGGEVAQLNKKQLIGEIYHFLVDELNLDPKRLFISVFGGGKVKDRHFDPDKESIELWKSFGISDDRIVSMPGDNNFVYLQRDGDAAGPRCEIYYDRGEDFSLNRYVEIASVIFETYWFSKGQLVESKNVVAGGAFGIERLAMILNNVGSIYEVDTFDTLVGIIKNQLEDKKLGILFREKLYSFADLFRASVFILNAGQLPDKSKRGELLKKILRMMASYKQFFGLSDNVYKWLLDEVVKIYADQYPELGQNKQNILNIINEKTGEAL